MNKWEIRAIKAGYIIGTKGAVMRYSNNTEPVDIPIWCIAATDGNNKVLIDTGVDNLERVHKNSDPMIRQNDDMKTVAAIKDLLGWSPDEVNIVINTHLHFDHCGCNRFFPNATFYIQRSEYESAFAPPKPIAHLYDPYFFDKKAISYFKWKFLDGECEILPGLICIPTPGHTIGHQSVLINTDFGTVCAAGDVSSVADNINNDNEPVITLNTEQVLNSFHRIRIRADYIIPGHEYSISNGEIADFPRIK